VTRHNADGDGMKRYLAAILIISLQPAVLAQTARVLPSRPDEFDTASRRRVYHPEPILFVHGNNANDKGWGDAAIPALMPEFIRYDLPDAAISLIGWFTNANATAYYNAPQTNYLHTLNYGNYVYRDRPHNMQSYDPVIYNASGYDLANSFFQNRFRGNPLPTLISPPSDNRQTLDMRINQIRTAYRPGTGVAEPQVVLVAHSFGACLAHWHMLRAYPDHGVRRLVTVAGAHQGTLLANFLLADHYVNTVGRAFDEARQGRMARTIRHGAKGYVESELPMSDFVAGFLEHGDRGVIQYLVQTVGLFFTPSLNYTNEFLEVFWNSPSPKIEYVFNVYRRPQTSDPRKDEFVLLKAAAQEPALEDPIFVSGDGFIPANSAAGKDGPNYPSIWNGRSNPGGNHVIDPVIFGTWTNVNHSQAVTHTNSLYKSLFGVPYRWAAGINDWPAYARFYGENQSFSKYFASPSSNSVAHTDEPGIAELKLLYQRSGENRLLIPSLNTWTTNSTAPQKTLTNASDFVGHQIVASAGFNVRYVGTTGAKNRSENPVHVNGANYWVVSGNEYLPASLSVKATRGLFPINVATNISGLAGASKIVNNCLVQLDGSGAPQHQYGHFEGSVFITAKTNSYVAVQGHNLANLLTPQAERAFDSPVESATLVAVLTKINAGEALSNHCHAASEPTRWTATVSEWATVPSNGVVTPNFFPVDASPNVRDAWTGTDFTGFNYDEINKTLTVTDPADAPSQLIISNQVYLGCAQVFTNDYDGVVTNLDGTVIESWSVQYTADIWWE
jgi:hypothetical protein